MRERDWDNLIWNVRRARSVLFTGPDLDAGAGGHTAALTARLGDLLRDERRPVLGHSLPAVAQQLAAQGHVPPMSDDAFTSLMTFQ